MSFLDGAMHEARSAVRPPDRPAVLPRRRGLASDEAETGSMATGGTPIGMFRPLGIWIRCSPGPFPGPFEPGPFPGLPAPAVGPKGPESGKHPRAGFIILSSLLGCSAHLVSGSGACIEEVIQIIPFIWV